ncbi:hypothetical protein J3E68DRAFT_389148 [Trichoderma sp. SZMC 28012]
MFCISLFACFVQQYIFSMLAFVSRNLANGMRRVYLPLFNLARPAVHRVIQLLPTNLNPLKKSKKKTGGRPRSVSDKSGTR